MAQEVYPEGPGRPEVKEYVKAHSSKKYVHSRAGKQQHKVSRPNVTRGSTLLQPVLEDGAWSVQRSGAGKVREGVLDGSSEVWEQKSPVLWLGEGAPPHPKGATSDHKQVSGFRRTCSMALTSTAAGRMLKPVVHGRARDFGLEGDTGRKLKQMRQWEVPSLGSWRISWRSFQTSLVSSTPKPTLSLW